jgi:antitoxin (DNA-binding transcriptional repressor) of toxin-antitoxin stability system
MNSISLRELHERTGAWVRKAAELGAIIVTERGKPMARLEAVSEAKAANPFRARRAPAGICTPPGHAQPRDDSTAIISADRERASPS